MEVIKLEKPAAEVEPKIAPMAAIGLFEHGNTRWILDETRPEVTHADLQYSAYWSVVRGRGMKPFDYVDVRGIGANGLWCATVRIIACEAGRPVQVDVLDVKEYSQPSTARSGDEPDGHTVRFDPLTGLYSGWRDKDGRQLTPWFDDRKVALRELQDHATLRA